MHLWGSAGRRNCDLDIPSGRVVGLVGTNGAGKSTSLNLACGMLTPTVGTIEVCGGRPAEGVGQLAKVGFVAQGTPVYAALSVADHLDFGKRLNPDWDGALARDQVRRLGLDPQQKAGKLSGGQRAQLALTLGIAKRPELLILDEPVAACRWPATSTTWAPATTGSPDRAATRPRSRPASTSSRPATPNGRPPSWCAPAPRSTIRPGP